MKAWRLWRGPAASTAALALAAEAALRLAGFQYSHVPIGLRYVKSIAQIGGSQTFAGRHVEIRYVPDRTLLWRPLPEPGVTNSLGFLGPEWDDAASPGRRRLIALGDSCTIAGRSPYPQQLAALPAAARWEVLNAGVGSWSSYQGRRLLETRLLRFRPDLVTVYFGWNDHWLAWAAPDKDLSALLDRQWRLLAAAGHSRLLQALLFLSARIRGLPAFDARTPPRVSLDDYEANLRAIVAMARASGGEALLITAPSALGPDSPLMRVLTERTHNFFDPSRIIAVHEAYNERVRLVARDTSAPLVDLARDFAREGNPGALFTDGLHLSPEGHRRLARALAGRLLVLGRKKPHNIPVAPAS